MTDDVDKWWREHLDGYRSDGRRDADEGVYRPPHALPEENPDPQYFDENMAYKDGFMKRRRELGEDFKWA